MRSQLDFFKREGEPPKAQTWLIVGCGKQKAPSYARAEKLYTGTITRARIAYAQRSGKLWYILSAKHGLIAGETFLAPYDLTIDDLRSDELARWQVNVTGQLAGLLAPDQSPASVTIELHAGQDYRNAIEPLLSALGFNVTAPTEGRGMFDLISFYKAAA